MQGQRTSLWVAFEPGHHCLLQQHQSPPENRQDVLPEAECGHPLANAHLPLHAGGTAA